MYRGSAVHPVDIEKKQTIAQLSSIQQKSCWHGKYRFYCTGIFVGILVGAIPVIILITLYTQKLNSGTTTTAGLTPVLRWKTQGVTIAGNGTMGIDLNQMNTPRGLALDRFNTLYVADTNNHRILKFLSGASTSTVVAGQVLGITSSTGYGLNGPKGVVVDQNGNLYIPDMNNHRIQFWASGSSMGVTVAGTGTLGSGLGSLFFPQSVTLDSNSGVMYIADSTNQRVLRWTPGASSGTLAVGGNGGGTLIIQLATPTSIYLDSVSNSLIISNYDTHTVVRWVLGIGSWTLIGGNITGVAGSSSTNLNRPQGVTVDPMGNVYVADASNHRIQLFLNGQSNAITIAGYTNISGNNSTLLNTPYGVALDNQLNLYVADTNNNRIQKFVRY